MPPFFIFWVIKSLACFLVFLPPLFTAADHVIRRSGPVRLRKVCRPWDDVCVSIFAPSLPA
jgi:hypothetical protein